MAAMKRTSYQNGSVVLKPSKKGPDVWHFRYQDGQKRLSRRVGTIQKYRTKAAAEKAAAAFREEINDRVNCITMSALIARYEKDELPQRHSTAAAYKSNLKRIREAFGSMRVDVLAKDIMAVEQWINECRTIETPGRPSREASKKTKINLKAVLHRLFECAIKWGSLSMQRNPVSLVDIRGRRKRVRTANLITGEQWGKLIADPNLCEHVRTMLYIAMILGLRASEILGLHWDDIDFDGKKVHIRRSSVGKHMDDTKTEASEQELPMHEDLERVLRDWKALNTADDGSSLSVNGWLFGNMTTGRPFWRDSLQEDHLVPAGRKVGIPNLGWHDFRHTYRAMMRELNISLEEQRGLMRHEDIRTTLSYGGKTPAEFGRAANAKIVEMLKRRA